MEPQHLTVTEAAQLLGVDRKTVFKLIAAGLPHQRLTPRLIRIDRRELESWGRTSNAT